MSTKKAYKYSLSQEFAASREYSFWRLTLNYSLCVVQEAAFTDPNLLAIDHSFVILLHPIFSYPSFKKI